MELSFFTLKEAAIESKNVKINVEIFGLREDIGKTIVRIITGRPSGETLT
jgi:hypothetical protein